MCKAFSNLKNFMLKRVILVQAAKRSILIKHTIWYGDCPYLIFNKPNWCVWRIQLNVQQKCCSYKKACWLLKGLNIQSVLVLYWKLTSTNKVGVSWRLSEHDKELEWTYEQCSWQSQLTTSGWQRFWTCSSKSTLQTLQSGCSVNWE